MYNSYKIFAIQMSIVLQILCDELVPQYRTSGTKDLEVVQKEFLSVMRKAVDAAIEHQESSNGTEPIDVPQLKELKDMLRTVNGTDLEELQAQNMDALRRGRLDVTLADMAKMFAMKKQQQLKLEAAAAENREKMRKRIERWAEKEAKKEAMKEAKKAKVGKVKV